MPWFSSPVSKHKVVHARFVDSEGFDAVAGVALISGGRSRR